MNLNDEELQRRIEDGHLNDDIDGRAYKHVFDALRKEPGSNLSPTFADRVVQRAIALNQKKESSKDFLWLGVGFFLLLVCMIVAFAYAGVDKLNLNAFRGLWDYRGIVLGGVVMVVAFNWLDKKLVRTRIDI